MRLSKLLSVFLRSLTKKGKKKAGPKAGSVLCGAGLGEECSSGTKKRTNFMATSCHTEKRSEGYPAENILQTLQL